MTQEEILKQGAPIEPNCFETEREEQWYKVGLYEGATASPWHSVVDGDLPEEANGDAIDPPFLVTVRDGYTFMAYYGRGEEDGEMNFFDDCGLALAVDYWMEIPKLPTE